MPRAYIRAGELHHGYEPHDLPGAWIPTRFQVVDPTGTTDPDKINWDGPCIWQAGREGVPDGWRPLWLGTERTCNPIVVHVATEVTPSTMTYEAAYRRGFSARREPKPREGEDVAALFDGWREGRAARKKMI